MEVLDEADGTMGPLPAELEFNADTEVFTISKCPAGVLDTSPGDDAECMRLPFDKQITVAVVYQL